MSSRRFVEKSVIPRASLNQGVRIDDQIFRWQSSWHESESLVFIANNQKACDTCDVQLNKGELASKGIRQVNVDAPFPVEGVDIIHLKCDDCYKDMNIKDILKNRDVTSFANFASLTRDEKIKWLKESGQNVSLADEKLTMEGFKFVITGNFRNKDELLGLITSCGGTIATAMNKSVSHCLVGSKGKRDKSRFLSSYCYHSCF
jgi:hypothetical protein